jgi:hypothetical protein
LFAVGIPPFPGAVSTLFWTCFCSFLRNHFRVISEYLPVDFATLFQFLPTKSVLFALELLSGRFELHPSPLWVVLRLFLGQCFTVANRDVSLLKGFCYSMRMSWSSMLSLSRSVVVGHL